MKTIIISFGLIIAIILQASAQTGGDLHVKGKIRSDSLANQNYLLIYADSTGTLDTLELGAAGQVLISNGPGQKPTWTTPFSTLSFDPHFPDGTDSLTGVAVNLINSTPYIVPAGKNLHITGIYKASPPNNQQLFINGDSIMYDVYVSYYANLSLILSAGDTISTNVSNVGDISFTGYLVNPKVTPVIHNLTESPFTVPSGKTLYINVVSVSLSVTSNSTLINGAYIGSLNTGCYFNGIPIIANSGDVISCTNTNNVDIVLLGYFK